jgi:pimeloyl-ACP methyl ester carboxylesterase
MDYLGVEQAHLVGTSMGGLITQETCVQHPNRVISATIANSFSFPHGRILRSTRAWELAMEKMPFEEAFDVLLPWIVGEKMFESPLFETVYGQMKEMFVKANTNWCFKNKIKAIRAREQDTLQDRIKEIKNPILLIGGSDDILTPPKYQEYTKSLIPHAELVIIPNVGHASILDNPDAFNSIVISFLKKYAINKID